MIKLEEKIPINFYINKECNYNCKICFSRFENKKNLTYNEYLKIIDKLIGKVDKITFVGGEPLLYSKLSDLITYSKSKGFITSLVTNGSKITEEFFQKIDGKLDWIALSIDSLNINTNLIMCRGTINEQVNFIEVIKLIKKYKMKFKINTVVSRNNYTELFTEFIQWAKPDRWKIFQALILKDINDKNKNEIEITSTQFKFFVENNKSESIEPTIENNNAMIGSYYMIDPYGRLFDNQDNKISYSSTLLNVSLEKALNQINVSFEKMKNRDGMYYSISS